MSLPVMQQAGLLPCPCTGGLHFCVQGCLKDVLVTEGLAAVFLGWLCFTVTALSAAAGVRLMAAGVPEQR